MTRSVDIRLQTPSLLLLLVDGRAVHPRVDNRQFGTQPLLQGCAVH